MRGSLGEVHLLGLSPSSSSSPSFSSSSFSSSHFLTIFWISLPRSSSSTISLDHAFSRYRSSPSPCSYPPHWRAGAGSCFLLPGFYLLWSTHILSITLTLSSYIYSALHTSVVGGVGFFYRWGGGGGGGSRCFFVFVLCSFLVLAGSSCCWFCCKILAWRKRWGVFTSLQQMYGSRTC